MDSTCEHCNQDYALRDGSDPTPLCDDCAHAEVERLRAVLQIIRDYYSGSGYIGALADDALKPPNDQAQRLPTGGGRGAQKGESK